MEQLNKVELRGVVGNAKSQSVGDCSVTRFSVATDYIYKSRSGMPVVETTWHQCVAFSNNVPDADKLERGKGVHVTGRLRMLRYMGADGSERTITEILVQSLEIL